MNALDLVERLSPDRATVLRIDAEHAGELLRRQHEAIVKLRESLKDAVVALRHVESIGMRVNPPTLTVAEQALQETEEF